ncbi:5'-nucleotidase domain-containing protein 2 [Phascolarctos cinereus]|uniref:5'-nucleotidase domain-containing protein 2 n=1 Tax=Phascolarctos cinereus TaxID=38626 RepID=A0A6P5IYE0_PHACI|nr:5'-nucleotidase domain-containing protein 2 [Phascolarctos cinereus]
MAGAGLRAVGCRWLRLRGDDVPGWQRAAAASSCQGCGPSVPGHACAGSSSPGAHCPVASASYSSPDGVAQRSAAPAPDAQSPEPSAYLWSRYREMRKLVHDLLPPEVCNLLNPAAIYANNEISLGDVEVYGFDYDYTLAQYSDSLHSMIFNTAREILIQQYKYPGEIRKYDYIPDFAIRGLHYDVQKSLLMKIDAFHYVQLGTAYRGLQPVPDEEVIDLYGGTQHIPLYQMSDFYGKGPSIKQFMDIFSLPEMALLSSVVDHFLAQSLEFDQTHLYKDVSDAIRDVHVKGLMYQWIEKDMEKYILRGDETHAVLTRLVNHGKKLFLITNSPFSFVNKGMKHMVGKDWRDLFDVVIVRADKPTFFTDRRKPFRKLDESGVLQWDKINHLKKGTIYRQGNLFDFLHLTGWRGSRVLYFGDHLYSDLADLMLRHGWRTGAIIPELEREINTINTEQYMHSLTWQQALTGLLERMQTYRDAESRQVLAAWMKERQEIRSITKNLFNPPVRKHLPHLPQPHVLLSEARALLGPVHGLPELPAELQHRLHLLPPPHAAAARGPALDGPAVHGLHEDALPGGDGAHSLRLPRRCEACREVSRPGPAARKVLRQGPASSPLGARLVGWALRAQSVTQPSPYL